MDINIIQVYAPTSKRPEEEVDKFYDDLKKAKSQCKSQEVKSYKVTSTQRWEKAEVTISSESMDLVKAMKKEIDFLSGQK